MVGITICAWVAYTYEELELEQLHLAGLYIYKHQLFYGLSNGKQNINIWV